MMNHEFRALVSPYFSANNIEVEFTDYYGEVKTTRELPLRRFDLEVLINISDLSLENDPVYSDEVCEGILTIHVYNFKIADIDWKVLEEVPELNPFKNIKMSMLWTPIEGNTIKEIYMNAISESARVALNLDKDFIQWGWED